MSASSRFDNPYSSIDHAILSRSGLNMQAVFNTAALPPDLQQKLAALEPEASHYRQLLLIGHGGGTFWQRSRGFVARTGHPLDEFAVDTVQRFLADAAPGARYRVLYPGASLIPLQTLGQLAGWHHPSPMMVGINDYWGTWYAYRVALVADTDFAPSVRVNSASPCTTCVEKPCLAACPAGALRARDGLHLERCLDHRTAPASSCGGTCLARVACPVAPQHRYPDQQIDYHYRYSLAHIVKWRETGSRSR
ncbi:MAG: hypothetical protein ACOY7J_03175 [Pseudomonadota bacterium]